MWCGLLEDLEVPKFKTHVLAALMSSAALLGAAPAFAQQTPQVWTYLTSGGELQAIDALVAESNKQHPDTPIEHLGVPGSEAGLNQQLQVAILGGEPPAVYQANLGLALAMQARSGRLQSVEDVWAKVNGDAIYPDALKRVVTFDGKPWAIPVNIGVISNVYYNVAMFSELGLTPPTTIEEWDAICAKVIEAGKNCLANGAGPWTFQQSFPSIIATLGAEGYYKIASGQMPMDGDEIKQYLTYFRDHFAKNYMANWTGGQWTAGADSVMAGDTAMFLNGDWTAGYMAQRGFEPGVQFDSFVAPGINNASILQPDGWALVANTTPEQTAAGKAFMETTASVAGQEAFVVPKGSLAASNEVPSSIYNPIGKKAFERLADTNNPSYPNLYILVPPTFAADFATEIERFAANPTDDAIVQFGKTMEEKRQALLAQNAFADWQ